MKNIALIFILLGVIFTSFTLLRPPGSDLDVIVIDAGHGGKDPGCKGDRNKEKQVTLDIALKLGKLLKDSIPDMRVVFTRTSDTFIELSERSRIANSNKADLFVSIHCNANDKTTPYGTETYVMGLHKNDGNLKVSKRENESILLEDNYQKNESYGGFDPTSPVAHIIFSLYQNAYLAQSLKVAENVEKQFQNEQKLKSRGVKQAGFLVLWKTAMPSILVETGFLTNENDRKYLENDSGRAEVAYSLYEAIKVHKSSLEKKK
jgi:N-acetylmuramoyl-L-alanine amidase